MKTILGRKITAKSIYRNSFDKNRIGGAILMEGTNRIIISRGKFFIYEEGRFPMDSKKVGVILKGTETYKKIKRIIAIHLKTYRNHGNRN